MKAAGPSESPEGFSEPHAALLSRLPHTRRCLSCPRPLHWTVAPGLSREPRNPTTQQRQELGGKQLPKSGSAGAPWQKTRACKSHCPGPSRGPAPSLPWPRCPHRHRALACEAWVPPCPQRSRLQYERCPPSSPFRAQLRSRSRPEVQRRVCTDGRDHGTEDQRRGCEEATAPAADVYGRPGRPSLQVDVSNTRLSDASLRLQPAAPTLPQNCNLYQRRTVTT